MKRKIVLIIAIILTFSLALTACTQGTINEAKAKELALDNINKVFQTNQTEATVSRERQRAGSIL
jgi:ABC-type oligopeptide transport system substrate-binding subunit